MSLSAKLEAVEEERRGEELGTGRLLEKRWRAPCPGRARVLAILAQSRDEGWCACPFLQELLGQAKISLGISFSMSPGQG